MVRLFGGAGVVVQMLYVVHAVCCRCCCVVQLLYVAVTESHDVGIEQLLFSVDMVL